MQMLAAPLPSALDVFSLIPVPAPFLIFQLCAAPIRPVRQGRAIRKGFG